MCGRYLFSIFLFLFCSIELAPYKYVKDRRIFSTLPTSLSAPLSTSLSLYIYIYIYSVCVCVSMFVCVRVCERDRQTNTESEWVRYACLCKMYLAILVYGFLSPPLSLNICMCVYIYIYIYEDVLWDSQNDVEPWNVSAILILQLKNSLPIKMKKRSFTS